jgi:type II secretory pathway pseudopilin PulG
MRALKWIKEHLVWILGGIIAVLAAILAVSYEKDKTKAVYLGKKMDALKVEKTRIERLRSDTDEVVGEHNKTQKRIAKESNKIDTEIEKVRNEVKELSTDEVVDRFNRLYGQ